MYFVSATGLRKPDHVELNIVGQASRLSRPAQGARAAVSDQSETEAASPFGDRRDACPTLMDWLSTMRHGFAAELAEELKVTGLATNAPPAAASERTFAALKGWQVRLHQPDTEGWEYPASVLHRLGWPALRLVVGITTY
ncbi:MAG TPA: hypothetical protein VGJ75_21415 [Dongiaceae bacterium]